MIVVDASALVALVLDEPAGTATRLRERLGRSGETLHAPHLIDVEVAQALRQQVNRAAIAVETAEIALDLLARLPIALYPHSDLLQRAWAMRENVTAYDAVYVALSEMLGAPLITLDRGLANSPGHRAQFEVY